MDTIKQLSRQYIKENRFRIILYAALFSAVSTLITTLFNELGLSILGILFATCFVLLYFIKMNEIVNVIARGKKISKNIWFSKPEVTKRHALGFLMYVIFALIAFVALYFGTRVQFLGILVIVFIALMFGFVTGVVTVFLDLDGAFLADLKTSLKTVFSQKKLLLSYLFRTLTVTVQGAILTLCLNVFVFGPQIQKALVNATVDSPEVMQYFTNIPATFIQTSGAQVTMFYILFVGFVFYKTYAIQKHVHKRRKK